jgi:Fanconi anemia group D2 protein
VPQVKKRLEQTLLLVKGILQASGVAAVEVGNLKHKDLAGRVVASQAYLNSSSEESEGESGEKAEPPESAATESDDDREAEGEGREDITSEI